MKVEINRSALELVKGDITEQDVDAIVNAANSSLMLGGGVAGAIRRKGGPSIQEECNRIGACPVGNAVITTAGDLRARHVIHAVGPRMGEGHEDEKLRGATLRSLELADRRGLVSIAFPAISTGIFGFPIDRCADIMLTSVTEHLKGETHLKKIVFALFGDEAYTTFEKTLKRIQSDKGDDS
jgi:O-acetyl-ADP-ribose deacetylase (regulator of RNase III)